MAKCGRGERGELRPHRVGIKALSAIPHVYIGESFWIDC